MKASTEQPLRAFHVMAKPTGAQCNLKCDYCFFLKKDRLYPDSDFRMSDETMEAYIRQTIEGHSVPEVSIAWQGGEPTLMGLDFFRRAAEVEKKYIKPGMRIENTLQTNGVLIDEEWCKFFHENNFLIGLSLDGPQEMHDRHRVTKDRKPTHEQTMRGYRLLQKHGVYTDILCVVNAHNVQFPLQVYRFFKQINAQNITFLPMVEPQPDSGGVTPISVPAEAWGAFLCTIFDEWREQDIGRVKVQIFEEAARTAFNQEHSLCIFRPTCGDIPVIEHNGAFYSCDHFVDQEHRLGNITKTPLLELLESPAQTAFGRAKWETLPSFCRECEIRPMCNGECPKNRFLRTPDGEPGLNYLCAGYKRFFTHCQPFVSEVAAHWRRQNLEGAR